LVAHADTGRSARGDDVSRLERHEVTDIAHDPGDRKDHGTGVAGLHPLAIHLEPHVEALHIVHLVTGHQPGTHRPKGVAALALVPRAAALELIFPLRKIIDHAVAGDVLERVALIHIACRRADHDPELDLPVRLRRAPREHHIVIGALQTAHRL